jgi:hypothetical protein
MMTNDTARSAGRFLLSVLLTGVVLNLTSRAAGDQPATGPAPVAAPAMKPFPVRAVHLQTHLARPEYQAVMDQAVALGYNVFIIGFGPRTGIHFEVAEPGKIRFTSGTADDVRALIAHARQIGLEPILEIKIIGKQRSILGELARRHPGLITEAPGQKREFHSVLNSGFRFPDGRDPYEAVVLPMLDEMIALYGDRPPRYLLLGVDEPAVSKLSEVGKPLGWSAAEVLADGINRCVEHLLARGITPIMWGDMFVSIKLAKPGHGVEGFDHDPRFSTGGALHAEFFSEDGTSVVTAMNHLRHRDRIIVAHWQYSPTSTGEYPAIDYFQKCGFKDVWGCTWYTEENIRQFSRYAARRGCGGMIASTWHTPINVSVKHLFAPTLYNSILYFRNPDFEPPASPPARLRPSGGEEWTTARTVVVAATAEAVEFAVDVPAGLTPRQARLWLREDGSDKVELVQAALEFDSSTRVLRGTLPLPRPAGKLPRALNLGYEYRVVEIGYLLQEFRKGALVVAERAPVPVGEARTDALLLADFRGLTGAELAGGVLRLPGAHGGILVVRGANGTNTTEGGALDCRQVESAFVYPEGSLWSRIDRDGMQMEVEFQLAENNADNARMCTVVSYGRFHGGFRLHLNPNGRLQLQFAETRDSVWPVTLMARTEVKPGQWVKATVTLSPRDGINPRTATLQMDDGPVATASLPCEPTAPEEPIGFGIEFERDDISKTPWPSFPGKLRRVKIRPY